MGGIAKKVIGGVGKGLGSIGGKLGGLIGLGAGGPAGGIIGSQIGDKGPGVVGDIAGAVSGAFKPFQQTVSGVPAELQAALEAAGISIEELIQAGGALPQFGGATGTDPNLEQLAASSGLQEQLGTERVGPDLTDFNSILEQLQNLQGPDTGRAAGLLDRVEGLATGPDQQRLIETLLPSLEQATAAERFDLTDRFKEGEAVFRGDLDEILANVKAESSALGLGAGSSDRNKRLLETAGKELSRFRLGQEDLASRSFESAEDRRIAAINAGGTVSGAVGRPAETLASIVPAALQEGGVGADFDLQKLIAGLDPSILAGQIPAQFDLAQRGQQSGDLARLFGMGTTERGFGESEINRLMSEFARTQTGGFELLQKMLAATPEQTTAFGPSTVSQIGDVAAGVGGIVGAMDAPPAGAPPLAGQQSAPDPTPVGAPPPAGTFDFGNLQAGDTGFTNTGSTNASTMPTFGTDMRFKGGDQTGGSMQQFLDQMAQRKQAAGSLPRLAPIG